jgi:hypothetical protein
MKNLLTAALIFAATSLFGVESPPPPLYCDCVGVGRPHKEAPHLHTTTTVAKDSHLSFAQRAFYEIELWAILFSAGAYR